MMSVNPNINTGGGPASGPPPDLAVGSPGQGGGSLLLPKDLFDICVPAFDGVGCRLLDTCSKDHALPFLRQPLHNCARIERTGEVALFYMAKEHISDPEKLNVLVQAGDAILRDKVVGIYVFTDADSLPDNYLALLDAWYWNDNLRRADFILQPQIQSIKAIGDEAERKQRLIRMLRLEMLAGKFDRIDGGEKYRLAEYLGSKLNSTSNPGDVLLAVIQELNLPPNPGDESFARAREPLGSMDKVLKIMNLLEGRIYPDGYEYSGLKRYSMLGYFLYQLSEKFGKDVAETPLAFIAKYRLITDRAKLRELQADYPMVDF